MIEIENYLKEMTDYYGEQVAITLARKHIDCYSGGFRGSSEFRAKINITGSGDGGAQIIRDVIEQFYDSQI